MSSSTRSTRKSKQSEYLYFVYRNIPEGDMCNLTDFIGKIGRGTGNRWKDYGTAYGSNYTTCIWYTPDANRYEKEILNHYRKKGMLHKHQSGKSTEVLMFSVQSNMTVRQAIRQYKQMCTEVRRKISDTVGSELKTMNDYAVIQAATPRPSLWKQFVSLFKG